MYGGLDISGLLVGGFCGMVAEGFCGGWCWWLCAGLIEGGMVEEDFVCVVGGMGWFCLVWVGFVGEGGRDTLLISSFFFERGE